MDTRKDVLVKVVVGSAFSLVIIWYFSYWIIGGFLLPGLSLKIKLYSSFVFSFLSCLLLVKRSIEIESQKAEVPFSLVARNPKESIYREKFTLKRFAIKLLFSFGFTFSISLPFLIAAGIQSTAEERGVFEIYFAFIVDYWLLHLIALGMALFILFVILPSYRNWHWTKPQF